MAAKKQPDVRRKNRPGPTRRLRRWPGLLVVAAAVVVAAFWWNSRNGQTGEVADSRLSEATQKLLGRWQRTDAGYVIEIRDIAPDGTVEASYLNPNSIHVDEARVSEVNSSLRLFIKLMDIGYPGATYDLTYSPEHDALVGLYYQPTAKQSFEVAFRRKG